MHQNYIDDDAEVRFGPTEVIIEKIVEVPKVEYRVIGKIVEVPKVER